MVNSLALVSSATGTSVAIPGPLPMHHTAWHNIWNMDSIQMIITVISPYLASAWLCKNGITATNLCLILPTPRQLAQPGATYLPHTYSLSQLR